MTQTPLSEIGNPQARLDELEVRLRRESFDELIPVLLERLDDAFPPVRHRAANALADARDDRLAALAAAILHQPLDSLEQVPGTFGWEVEVKNTTAWRQAACTILAAHGSGEAREGLVLATNDEDADVRYEALVGLHKRDDIEPQKLERTAGTRLQDSDPEVATVAAQIIAEHGWTDFADAMAAIWNRMEGAAHFQFALALAELVGEHGASLDKDTVDAVLEELTDALGDEERTAAAARGLVMLGAERAKEPLKGVINRWFVHPLLRVDAAAALIELDDPEGFDYLEKALSHKRKDVRGSAIRVVGRLGLDRHFDTLAELARSHDYHAETALLALVEWGSEAALEVAEEMRDHHADSEMRELAERALKMRRERGRFSAEMLDFEELFTPPRDGEV